MSDVNFTTLGITEEVLPGTTPALPAFERLRMTGSNLKATPKTTESDEITGDMNVTDIPLVGIEPGGSLNAESVYGNLATPLEGLMRNRWANTPVRDNNGTADTMITDVTATDTTILASNGTKYRSGTFVVGHLVRRSGFGVAGNNTLARAAAGTTATVIKVTGAIEAAPPGTARAKVVGFEGASGDITATATGLASTALDFTTLGLTPGQWLKTGGSAAGEQFAIVPANNAFVRVSETVAVTATALPLDNLPTGWGVDAGTGKTIRVWMADVLVNGSAKIFYTLEQAYSDLTVPEWEYYTGSRANSLDVNIPKKEKVTLSLDFVSMGFSDVTTRVAGATDVAAVTGDVMNTSSNVARIAENGARILGPNNVTGIKFQLTNNLRRRDEVANIGSFGFGDGKLKATGTIDLYYGSKAIRDKILTSTATSLNVILRDPLGTKAIVYDFPRVKFTGGDPNSSAVDTDRMISPGFQALRTTPIGSAVAISARMCRFEEFA